MAKSDEELFEEGIQKRPAGDEPTDEELFELGRQEGPIKLSEPSFKEQLFGGLASLASGHPLFGLAPESYKRSAAIATRQMSPEVLGVPVLPAVESAAATAPIALASLPARLALGAGVGAASAGLAAKPEEGLEEAIIGGLEGLAGGALGEIVGVGLGAGARAIARKAPTAVPAFADWLRQKGIDVGRKVIQGRSDIAAATRKPLSDEAVEEVVKRGGLKPGRTTLETAGHIETAVDAADQRLNDALDKLADAGSPGGNLLKMRRQVVDLYRDARNRMATPEANVYAQKANEMAAMAKRRAAAGQSMDLDLQHAEQIKRSLQEQAKKAGAYNDMDLKLAADAKAKVASVVRAANEDAATRFSASAGRPQDAKEFIDAKRSMKNLLEAKGFADKATTKELQKAPQKGLVQRGLEAAKSAAMSPLVVGGAAGAGSMAMNAPLLAGGLWALGAAGRLAQTRGGSAKAIAAMRAGEALRGAAPAITGAARRLGAADIGALTGPLGSAAAAANARQNAYDELERRFGIRAQSDEEVASEALVRSATDPDFQPGRR